MRIEVSSGEGVSGVFDDDMADVYEVIDAFVDLLILEGYAPVSVYRGLDNAIYNIKQRFKGVPFEEEAVAFEIDQ